MADTDDKQGTWRVALTIGGEATHKQRQRNREMYETLKREMPRFCRDDGTLIPPRELDRLLHCIADCMPTECDADAEVDRLAAENVKLRADLDASRARLAQHVRCPSCHALIPSEVARG